MFSTMTESDKLTDVIIRRATAGDCDAVIGMVDGVFCGTDYIPTLFHDQIHSSRNALYVAETKTDRSLVSFLNARFSPDGRWAAMLSLRTRPDCRRRGLNQSLIEKFCKDYPSIERIVQDGIYSDLGGKVLRANVNFEWNVIKLAFDKSRQLESAKNLELPSHSSVALLTQSEATELVISGRAEQFLRQFSSQYVSTAHCTWVEVELTTDGLQDMLDMIDVTAVTHGPRSEILSLSFESNFVVKTKQLNGWITTNIQYFGSDMENLADHVRVQLSRVTSTVNNRNIVVHIHFPVFFDITEVVKYLSRFVITDVSDDLLLREKAAVISTEVLKSS